MQGFLHVTALIVTVLLSSLFIAGLLWHRSRVRAAKRASADAWTHRDAWERAAFEASQNRFQWIYSGLGVGDKNFMHDLGTIRSREFCTREQAIANLSNFAPRGAVVHVDDTNKVITYKVV